MNEPLDHLEVDRFDAEIVVGPDVSPTELTLAAGVAIPCPGDEPGECDTAELLSGKYAEDNARAVEESLGEIAESERTAGEENNLGCALAWREDWAAAKEAFARGKVATSGSDRDRELAARNESVADRALSV
jgi:hypothetical protein